MMKPEEKSAPVNVVVVTGDKNELSGLSNITEKNNSLKNNPINGGGQENKKDESQDLKPNGIGGGESNGIIDFAKSFFIKKMDG